MFPIFPNGPKIPVEPSAVAVGDDEPRLHAGEEVLDFHADRRNHAVVGLLPFREPLPLRFLFGHEHFVGREILPDPEESEVRPNGVGENRFHEPAFFQKPVVVDGSRFRFPNRQDAVFGSYGEVLFRVGPLFSGVVAPLVFRRGTPSDWALGGVDEDVPDFRTFRKDFCQSDSVGSRNQSVFFKAESRTGSSSASRAYALDLGRSKAPQSVAYVWLVLSQ